MLFSNQFYAYPVYINVPRCQRVVRSVVPATLNYSHLLMRPLAEGYRDRKVIVEEGFDKILSQICIANSGLIRVIVLLCQFIGHNIINTSSI